MYLEACGQPQLTPFPRNRHALFHLLARRTLYFCSAAGVAVVSAYRADRYFIPLDLAELNAKLIAVG